MDGRERIDLRAGCAERPQRPDLVRLVACIIWSRPPGRGRGAGQGSVAGTAGRGLAGRLVPRDAPAEVRWYALDDLRSPRRRNVISRRDRGGGGSDRDRL